MKKFLILTSEPNNQNNFRKFLSHYTDLGIDVVVLSEDESFSNEGSITINNTLSLFNYIDKFNYTNIIFVDKDIFFDKVVFNQIQKNSINYEIIKWDDKYFFDVNSKKINYYQEPSLKKRKNNRERIKYSIYTISTNIIKKNKNINWINYFNEIYKYFWLKPISCENHKIKNKTLLNDGGKIIHEISDENTKESIKIVYTKNNDYYLGVGITTKNRSHILEKTLSNIKHHTTHEKLKIVLVDDNSNEYHKIKNFELCKKYNIDYYFNNKNLGIAKSKNRCIEYIDDTDFLFLYDDDCYPVKDYWWEPFITAYQEYGNEHFSLSFDKNKDGRPNGNNIINEINNKKNDISLESFSNPCGILLFLTKNVLEKIGGFDNRYDLYGKEHVGYSLRCYNMGLTKSKFLSVKNTLKYFYSYDYENQLSSVLSYNEKEKSRKKNNIIFNDEKVSYNYKLFKKSNVVTVFINDETNILEFVKNNKISIGFDTLLIILHNNLNLNFIKKNTTSKIKFFKTNSVDSISPHETFFNENNFYIKTHTIIEQQKKVEVDEYKIFNNTKNKIDVVMATILTDVEDLQRKIRWENNNFNIISDWYFSMKHHNVNAVIFHNTFSKDITEKYTTEKIKFIRVDYSGELNPNVYRYFFYKDFLKENKYFIKNVFLTDINDVIMLNNPFKSNFFKSYNNFLFSGDEEITYSGSKWIKLHNTHLRQNIDNFIEYEKNNYEKKLLNCGIIGGNVKNIINLVDKICNIHETVTITNKTKYTCDMGVYNYVMRQNFNEKVKHGIPINTKFKYYEKKTEQIWFKHK